jgi:hypothetical protein
MSVFQNALGSGKCVVVNSMAPRSSGVAHRQKGSILENATTWGWVVERSVLDELPSDSYNRGYLGTEEYTP